MVMKMNKTGFIKRLSEVTNYDISKCEEINRVLENNILIGKKNKIKLVNDFMEKLDFSKEEAEDLYEKCMSIITKEIKEKIKHPFKSKD